FSALVARARDVTLGAYAHQDLPFEKLVEELDPERDLSQTPLVQVIFVLQNAPMRPPEFAPGLGMNLEYVFAGTSKFDLTLGMEEVAGELLGEVEYSRDLFDASTVRRLVGHFRTLLAEVVEAPERGLSACALLTPPERQQLLAEWRTPASRVIPEAVTLHRLFEMQVERTPDAVAVVIGEDRLSFAELNARANRLAHQLRAEGIGPEEVVGCTAERGPEVVVGLLGILKAGGVYLPLDPNHPADRLDFMLRDAGARAILGWQGQTTPEEERTSDRSFKMLQSPSVLKFALVCPSHQDLPDPQLALDPDHLAYVIYTSGTTGMPKGVAVSHRQVLPVHAWFLRYLGLGKHTRVLQNLSPCFDFGVFELVTTLLAGGSLTFLPAAEQGDPARHLDAVERHALNTVHTTPSFFRELTTRGRPLSGLEIVHLGGEAIGRGLVREIEAMLSPGCRVYNGYGPTETSINSTVFRMQGRPLDRGVRGQVVPIGRPTEATTVYVLDRRGRPVPVGVPGELCIGGGGVARGY
ncbi:MAG: AMP-binding protein, partial [bacterium]|nr:AMP-binding protein [bacterium]